MNEDGREAIERKDLVEATDLSFSFSTTSRGVSGGSSGAWARASWKDSSLYLPSPRYCYDGRC